MQNPSYTCPQCQSPIPADAPGGLCPACVLLGVAGPTNLSQAATATVPTIEEVAAAFPELEILEIIGQGGMGIVFKARQPRLDRFVALKILPPALAAQPGFAERFTREARVLARLAHPHIVAIYDFGESAGFFHLTMEFVNGVNLRAAMRAGVKPEQALLLVPRICEALQFAHDHGVLHRDIKPENILLDTNGTPKLADFGIAKLMGDGTHGINESHATHASQLTQAGATLGTAAYMAPEQVEQPATVDHRADIYSLGVVLYEMLTGELPLGRFGAPSEKSSVNRGVDEVVMRALEKERERRQQSAGEMKTQVEGATPGATAGPRRNSFETLSSQRLFCLPLYHFVHGPDPRTGVPPVARAVFASGPVAKGIVAVGGRAHGVIACGGMAVGGLAIGGLTIGGICLGGVGIGIVSVGGMALGLASATGGMAVGQNALGGIAVGLKAAGGLALPLAGLGPATPALLWLIANLLLVFVAWTIIPDLLAAARAASRLPADAPKDPWPQRIFFLIFAIILLPTLLIGLGVLIPKLASRASEKLISVNAVSRGNPGKASVEVHYAPADPKFPGIHKLTLNMRTQYGWVTDFSFRIRDEKGERELPYASFIVAQQPPSQPHTAVELNAEMSWQLNTRDMLDGYFQLNAKLNKGSAGHAGGSTSDATAFRWEPHPGRSEWSRSLTAEAPAQIFFLRGLPIEAGLPAKPEAEMYVLVKTRPMQPGEKAAGFQGFLGPDRFEKLIPVEVQHDDAIRRAAQQLDETQARIKAGVPVVIPLEKAELNLAIAEARGHAHRIAKAKVRYAETRLHSVQKENLAGTLEAEYIRAATMELDAARAEEKRALQEMVRP